VDGDRAAAAIGAALHTDTLLILTNVPGLLRDVEDEQSLIPSIPQSQAEDYLDRYAQGRMKRKILGAVEAMREGVKQVIIADGRVSEPVTKALNGQGTVIK
jgi:acetylglutamate/LysW-gamma-L-alpha-aminoadipate kinase